MMIWKNFEKENRRALALPHGSFSA